MFLQMQNHCSFFKNGWTPQVFILPRQVIELKTVLQVHSKLEMKYSPHFSVGEV